EPGLCTGLSEGSMIASKRVAPLESWPAAEPPDEIRAGAAAPQALPDLQRTPALRLKPLLVPAHPRRFARVPTHAVGVFPEHREDPRATLNLPLRLRPVDGSP